MDLAAGGVPGTMTAAHPSTAGVRVSRLAAHLETLRPYDLVTVLLVAAAGAELAVPRADPAMVLLAALMALAAGAGALYAADYLTRHDDFTTKPDRPIPSGRLSATAARHCAAGGTVTALAVTVAVNWRGLLFIGAAAAGQVAYGRWLKDRGWWGDLAVGLSGWSCALLTAATFTATWPPPALWLPALALGLQGTFGNTLLALADLDTDRAVGCRTLPVRRGPAGAVVAMTGCATACYALAATAPGVLHRPPTPGFVALTVAAAVLGTSCLPPAAFRRGPSHLAWATELHFYERVMLPAALLALAAGTLPVLCAVLAGVCVLALTPRSMLHAEALTGGPAGGR
ncbi:UbiA family prenyltransferase [Actinacidiphila yeochonensis]|uniref:UbiA family prenyltransferase n=1 Tax=Actinacidiphila yeochonensis TaxID=89050 RepID=UPI0006908B7E|nr:UbiA family prenyltransferase [Actinacidiphila yeochonensis]